MTWTVKIWRTVKGRDKHRWERHSLAWRLAASILNLFRFHFSIPQVYRQVGLELFLAHELLALCYISHLVPLCTRRHQTAATEHRWMHSIHAQFALQTVPTKCACDWIRSRFHEEGIWNSSTIRYNLTEADATEGDGEKSNRGGKSRSSWSGVTGAEVLGSIWRCSHISTLSLAMSFFVPTCSSESLW